MSLRNYFAARVVATLCGDPVSGVWCDDCQLPSVVAAPLLLDLVNGPSSVLMLRVAQACDGCDREIVT